MIFVGDIVEENGKTWKENNLAIEHKIPLGTLCEVNWEGGEYNGIRLFVVRHERDCDGTPLYGLSFNKEQNPPRDDVSPVVYTKDPKGAFVYYHLEADILHGISEDSLTVIANKES